MKGAIMQRYIIEREIRGAGALGEGDIANISKVSNGVLDAMHAEGAAIEWVESYAAGDKIYCIYDALDLSSERLQHMLQPNPSLATRVQEQRSLRQ
jgi:hypothetical protein